MEILIKILGLLFSLSLLVIFHEFGHFFAAKIFKTRVEKFYLFFNPWFSIFKFKHKDTEYGLGWLPLGGYVKISGMIDESLDREQLSKPVQPWEFRSKPAWQRLIIMLGGVLVNIILAVIIYIFMLQYWGEKYLPTSEVKYGITVDSLAYEMGLRDGDKILTVDGRIIEEFHKIPGEMIIEFAKTVQVEREGQLVNIQIPEGFIRKLLAQRDPRFIDVRFPFIIEKVLEDSPAQKSGLLANDKIISVENTSTIYFHQFINEISSRKGQTVNIQILRISDTISTTVEVLPTGIIGVQAKSLSHFFDLKEKKYSFFEAIPAGTAKTYSTLENYLKQLNIVIFKPESGAYKQIGSFITIGSIFPYPWDWQAFWSLTAFLSVMLAILNILPIPALDGGHVLFLVYEMISRRTPSDKFLEYSQIVGMVLLFGLMIVAFYNDLTRFVFNLPFFN